MNDRDIIVIYYKQFTIDPEEYNEFNGAIRQINEDSFTKIILVPDGIISKVERL